MTLPVKFVARRAHNARNGDYYSLRVTYPDSKLPGDRSSEFGRIRMERGGWNAFSSDEDFDLELKAACHRAGRRCPISMLLAVIRNSYMDWNTKENSQPSRRMRHGSPALVTPLVPVRTGMSTTAFEIGAKPMPHKMSTPSRIVIVVDDLIVARGSKPSMLRNVRELKARGYSAFLGHTSRAVGEVWNTPAPTEA